MSGKIVAHYLPKAWLSEMRSHNKASFQLGNRTAKKIRSSFYKKKKKKISKFPGKKYWSE